MLQLPADTDPNNWHRHFAMECNNRAWELTTSTRTSEQDREMLDTAHASAWHWGIAGNEINHMRAKMLLAEVHACLGDGTLALAYAQEMQAYFLDHDTPDWEIAFTHAIHAHAALAAGELETYRESYRSAETAILAIAEQEDREIVWGTFNQIPRP
ncbi:MAG: hypothetical protein K9M98_06880 [Cephaloticoccus sp.]|nr:hypothetical protein [Cephaloticoccus sp.]MCF7760213.1 hypothetical protein [Cephaloticoccus sp.]